MVRTRRSCPDESLEALPMPSRSEVRTRSRSLSDAASPSRTTKNVETKSPAAGDSKASARSSRKGKSPSISAKKKAPGQSGGFTPLSPISKMAEDDALITMSLKHTPLKQKSEDDSNDDKVQTKTPPTIIKKTTIADEDTSIQRSLETTPMKQKNDYTSDEERMEGKTPPTVRRKAVMASQDTSNGKSATVPKSEESIDEENSVSNNSTEAVDDDGSVQEVDTGIKWDNDGSDIEIEQGNNVAPCKLTNHEMKKPSAAMTENRYDVTKDKRNSDTEIQSNVVEENIPKSVPKEMVTEIEKSKMSISKRKKKIEPKNELTHILPGYTAPLRLVTTWRDTQTPSAVSGASNSALEDLRKKAVREDTMFRKLHESARIMSERSTTGNFTASYRESHASFHTKRRKRLAPSTDTAGAVWFNMKATPMTEEVERDMSLIRNRNYLDPKRFYKSADKAKSDAKPVLQAGTVIEGPTEFFSSRLTKKQRKTNLVDEIMADPESSGWAQQKYKKMQQAKGAASRKWGKNIPNRKEYRKKKAL